MTEAANIKNAEICQLQFQKNVSLKTFNAANQKSLTRRRKHEK